jgi:hypothetical protein
MSTHLQRPARGPCRRSPVLAVLGLALLSTGSRVAAQTTEPVATLGRGDPTALAVAADGAVLYVGEGATVVRYGRRSEGHLGQELCVELGACALALAVGTERLWIAAGTQGCLGLALDGSEERISAHLPEAAERDWVCTDVALGAAFGAALFATEATSRALLFDPRDGAPLASVELGAGTARALCLDGSDVYVALARGGLLRLRAADPRRPQLERGPPATAFPEVAGSLAVPVQLADLVRCGPWLAVAADGAGLGTIDLREPWSPQSAVALRPLEHGGGGGLHAHRLAAEGEWLVVGADRAPLAVVEGAPFWTTGAMDAELRVGGIDYRASDFAPSEQLHWWEWSEDRFEPRGTRAVHGAFRGLWLGGGEVARLHLGGGAVLEPLAGPDPGAVALRSPGLAATDGVASLVEPGWWFWGRDPAGSTGTGFVHFDPQRGLQLAGDLPEGFELGLLHDAQWLDRDQSRGEWLVTGRGFGWQVVRLDHPPPAPAPVAPTVRHWSLPTPEPPHGPRGHTYFHSRRHGDLLLLTRSGARFGLVGYSVEEVSRDALAAPPGTALATAPRFQVETHGERFHAPFLTWRVAVSPGEPELALVAAGGHGGDGLGPARLLVYELRGLSAPRLAADYGSSRGPGLAVAVESLDLGGRRLALLVDAPRGLQVLDLGDPAAPAELAFHPVPPSDFDGAAETCLDLCVDPVDEGRAHVALAAGRRGVVLLELTVGPAPQRAVQLRELSTLDTPGLPYGVFFHRDRGRTWLAVGDHQAGVRVYGER